MPKKKEKSSRYNAAQYLVDEQAIQAYLSAVLAEPGPKVYAAALAEAEAARRLHRLPAPKVQSVTFYLDRRVARWLRAEAKRSEVSLELLANYILAHHL